LEDEQKKKLELALANHMKKHPIPIIYTLNGRALTDEKGRPLADAPSIEDLLIDDPAQYENTSAA
jgi:hypothetical protein